MTDGKQKGGKNLSTAYNEKRIERVRVTREAGKVERCHTTPHIGSYTVGQHSFDAVSLLLILHPHPRPALIKALLWHDCHERFLGDVPSTAKGTQKSLGRAYEEAATLVDKRFRFIPDLTTKEKEWLSAIDKLELWLWCLDQEVFGNKHIDQMTERLSLWFSTNEKFIPNNVYDFFCNFKWERSPDLEGDLSEKEH